MEAYQEWQYRLERQPVSFLGRELTAFDKQARQALGEYFHTAADNLVFIPNATHGVNIIARSVTLKPGDEILTTNHEYGACDYTWEFICQKTGATYIHQSITLPACSPEEMADQFWQGVTPRTKIIYLSHITSPTALDLPVDAICARARKVGILTLVDGAHAPGQVDLDLEAIGADWYTGNCHKSMSFTQRCRIPVLSPDVQRYIEPLVVSWGYHSTALTTTGSQFLDYLNWTGTKDPAASLAVPARNSVYARASLGCCSWGMRCNLLKLAIQRICSLVEMEPLYPLNSALYYQMGIAPLPPDIDISILKTHLYEDYHIEIPFN